MRLSLYLLNPAQNPLPEGDARKYQVVRLLQLFRGWTVEYAENLVDNRPDAVRLIFETINAQQMTDQATSTRHEWFP